MNDLIQRSGVSAFVTFLFIIGVCGQAQAQKSWTGGGDGASWFDAANWTPNGIPDIDDPTTIDSMDVININPINPGDTAFARSLRINGALKVSLLSGAVLYLDGTGSATTTFELLGDALFSSGGKLIIKGAISDGIKVTSGTLSNGVGATISILNFANNANGQGIEIESGSLFQNDGYLSIRGIGSNTEDGIVNDGTMNNLATGIIEINDIHGNSQSYGIENYETFLNRGLVVVDSVQAASGILVSGLTGSLTNEGIVNTSNILNLSKSGLDVLNGALLSGEGDFNCHLISIGSNNSILSPGTFSGAMTINGDLFMSTAARLKVEIFGDNGPGANTGHDQLVINGNVFFENSGLNKPTLEIVLLNSFVPAIHKNYSFLRFSGSVTGFLATTVDKPAGLTGWSWYNNIPGQLIFRRYCGGSNLTQNCSTASCKVWSGYYDASQEISFAGPHVVPQGEWVWFQAMQVELSNSFSVESGSVFQITIGPCGT